MSLEFKHHTCHGNVTFAQNHGVNRNCYSYSQKTHNQQVKQVVLPLHVEVDRADDSTQVFCRILMRLSSFLSVT